jgi:mannose-6-phosphate isomerase-like protein (cupin superfamily)
MVDGAESGGGFSLVEHPMQPRALAAPMHRHSREDEYSFVLEGRVGADLGGEIVYGEVGDLIFKPRGQWHTFWNAGDAPARILEIISPAGFEKFFDTMAELAGSGELNPVRLVALAAEYGTEVDVDSVRQLVAAHGLTFAMGPAPQ